MRGTRRAYYLPFYHLHGPERYGLRGCREGSQAGSSRKHGPVAGEPDTSLARNPANVARGPGSLHGAGRGTRESEPWILCR